MIKSIKAISRFDIFDLINNIYNPLHYKWYWIAISSNKQDDAIIKKASRNFRSIGCKEMVSLVFKNSVNEKFNNNDARQVLDFINKLNLDEDDICVIINCDTGTERSGAIAEFIRETIDFDKALFENENPCICPDLYTLNMLRSERCSRLHLCCN